MCNYTYICFSFNAMCIFRLQQKSSVLFSKTEIQHYLLWSIKCVSLTLNVVLSSYSINNSESYKHLWSFCNFTIIIKIKTTNFFTICYLSERYKWIKIAGNSIHFWNQSNTLSNILCVFFPLQVNSVNCNTSWKINLFMMYSDHKEEFLKGVSELSEMHQTILHQTQ